jgi:hypothetical protein
MILGVLPASTYQEVFVNISLPFVLLLRLQRRTAETRAQRRPGEAEDRNTEDWGSRSSKDDEHT